MRRLAIPLSLLLALQTASAAIAADSAKQPDVQNVQYRHRTRPRGYRHWRENIVAVQQETPPQVPSKSTDHAAAKADAPPPQVLIEAAIVEVTLKRDSDSGVNRALFGDTAKRSEFAGNSAAMNAITGYNPATVFSADGKPAPTVAEKANGIKSFGLVHGKTADALRMLESMGETKVLATPRLLVLNKYVAEVQLGNQLGYRTKNPDDGTWTEKSIHIGTRLRVRPFVSTDGMIRLEFLAERTTGHLDADGIPQTNAIQILTNVMVPDGATVTICDKPRTEVKRNRCAAPCLSCIPGPLSLLSWIAYSDNLFPSTDYAARTQLIVLLSSQTVRK